MAEDLINNKDIYFPSNLGTNDKLITLLNRASQTLCDWFSKADKNGPLPFDESFNCIMPAEDGNSEENLFSEIESLLNNSFNPVHPVSLAHLDPPPLIFSILGDLIAALYYVCYCSFVLKICVSKISHIIANKFFYYCIIITHKILFLKKK